MSSVEVGDAQKAIVRSVGLTQDAMRPDHWHLDHAVDIQEGETAWLTLDGQEPRAIEPYIAPEAT